MREAHLDMRMNSQDNSLLTAKDIINKYPQNRLVEIFKDYGEEKFSKKIASKICENRQKTGVIR